jgi:hypothetical protein
MLQRRLGNTLPGASFRHLPCTARYNPTDDRTRLIAVAPGVLRQWRARPCLDRLRSRSQPVERGKFFDCQAVAHFRISASRSLWDLNSSRLYIFSQKTFSSSIIAFTYRIRTGFLNSLIASTATQKIKIFWRAAER